MGISEIRLVLRSLSRRRSAFHDREDFKDSLAAEIRHRKPSASVSTDHEVDDSRRALDIWIRDSDQTIAILLRYKTDAFSGVVDEESVSLAAQAAQDHGRYDFLRDIEKLELLTHRRASTTGYCILLTNDHLYWEESKQSDTNDADFRIHEGRQLKGTLNWGPAAGRGSVKNREEPITLRDTYAMDWEEYSSPGTDVGETFRTLVVPVGRKR